MSAKALALCTLMAGPRLLAEVNVNTFLDSLAKVESNYDDKAIGDNGKAYGRYQIWQCVIDDVNRVYGTTYTHEDCFVRAKATAICRLYLNHWGMQYWNKYNRPVTVEVLARIWNGGPEGWAKASTFKYWQKVRAELFREVFVNLKS